MTLSIKSPMDTAVIEKLRAGDQVLISGVIYVARDAAHKRLVETLDRGERLPFKIEDRRFIIWGLPRPSPVRLSGRRGRPPADVWMPMRRV